MSTGYVHGYAEREAARLADQAETLEELLHDDVRFPAGGRVLEAGCGVRAQTVPLLRNSPGIALTSLDVSAESVAQARERVSGAGPAPGGLRGVEWLVADLFALPSRPPPSTTSSSASSWSTWPARWTCS